MSETGADKKPDFVVPIYQTFAGRDKFLGTAFLVEKTKLLTANHVVAIEDDPNQKRSNLFFRFEDQRVDIESVEHFPTPDIALLTAKKPSDYKSIVKLVVDIKWESKTLLTSKSLRVAGYKAETSTGLPRFRSPEVSPTTTVEDQRGFIPELQLGTRLAKGYSGSPAYFVSSDEYRVFGIAIEGDAPDSLLSFFDSSLVPVIVKTAGSEFGLAHTKRSCPYPGMKSFGQHGEFPFYGRRKEIDDILHLLRSNSFLTIIGASGSGKSSLLNAGVIPELAQSTLFDESDWAVLTIRPSELWDHDPLRKENGFIAGIESCLGGSIDDKNAPSTCATYIQQCTSGNSVGGQQRLLLFIDQFEELFSLQSDSENSRQITQSETEEFQKMIWRLSTINNCYVVLTIRADYFDCLMASPIWDVAFRPHRYELETLSTDGFRQAIENPAKDHGVEIGDALIERLIGETGNDPGILPFLQETLVLLWGKLQSNHLSVSDYESLMRRTIGGGSDNHDIQNGVEVALARHCNNVLDMLPNERHRQLAHRILLRLVHFGARSASRRNRTVGQLSSAHGDSSLFGNTLETLIQGRLLTVTDRRTGQDAKQNSNEQPVLADDNRMVDLSHDKIISGWPSFSKLIRLSRENEELRRKYEHKTDQWRQLGSQTFGSGLLDVAEIKEAQQWVSSDAAKLLGYDKDLEGLVRSSQISTSTFKWLFRLVPITILAALLITAIYLYDVAKRAQEKSEQNLVQAKIVKFDSGILEANSILSAIVELEQRYPEWASTQRTLLLKDIGNDGLAEIRQSGFVTQRVERISALLKEHEHADEGIAKLCNSLTNEIENRRTEFFDVVRLSPGVDRTTVESAFDQDIEVDQRGNISFPKNQNRTLARVGLRHDFSTRNFLFSARFTSPPNKGLGLFLNYCPNGEAVSIEIANLNERASSFGLFVKDLNGITLTSWPLNAEDLKGPITLGLRSLKGELKISVNSKEQVYFLPKVAISHFPISVGLICENGTMVNEVRMTEQRGQVWPTEISSAIRGYVNGAFEEAIQQLENHADPRSLAVRSLLVRQSNRDDSELAQANAKSLVVDEDKNTRLWSLYAKKEILLRLLNRKEWTASEFDAVVNSLLQFNSSECHSVFSYHETRLLFDGLSKAGERGSIPFHGFEKHFVKLQELSQIFSTFDFDKLTIAKIVDLDRMTGRRSKAAERVRDLAYSPRLTDLDRHIQLLFIRDLVWYLLEDSRFEEAGELVRRFKNQNDWSSNQLLQLDIESTRVLFSQGRFDECIEQLQKIDERYPRESFSYLEYSQAALDHPPGLVPS